MTTILQLIVLFFAKILDNTLSTAKTILIQRNRCVLAGLAMTLSNYLYFCITKNIVTIDRNFAILVVSIASGVGCWLAISLGSKLSKARTYVNVVMSDDKAAMQKFRDFLAEHHITNVAADSYTLDWDKKTITITAYAETKAESRLINDYLENNALKCKRLIQKY